MQCAVVCSARQVKMYPVLRKAGDLQEMDRRRMDETTRNNEAVKERRAATGRKRDGARTSEGKAAMIERGSEGLPYE